MKGGSVLAHVTDWNDADDEESAPTGEQKQKKSTTLLQVVPRGQSRNRCRRNRTFNLRIKSPLLCQLSYTPTSHAPYTR